MQDMLVPIFGENGAIIAQYVITLAVVLGLIVLVVWAIRRYGGGAVAAGRARHACRASRSSTPSPIDNKRRLVLVRRDNVEHLVLIGGPSDVVVEPSIVRQRVAQRPGQATPTPARPQPAGTSPQAAASAAGPCACSRGQRPGAPRVLPSRTPVAEAEPAETPSPSRRGGAAPRRASGSASPAAKRHGRAEGGIAPSRHPSPWTEPAVVAADGHAGARGRRAAVRSPPPSRPRRASRPRCTPAAGANRPRNRCRAIRHDAAGTSKRAASAFAPPDGAPGMTSAGARRRSNRTGPGERGRRSRRAADRGDRTRRKPRRSRPR